MAYSDPSTFVAGNVLTAAQQNVLANNDRFLHGPPTCRVRRAAAQAIVTGTWDTVQFDTEDWDSNTMWSSTNNDQVFVRTAGKYLACFTAGFNASTAGTFRGISIVKTSTASAGTGEQAESLASHDMLSLSPRLAVSQMFSMTTSDYLTAQVIHDRGVDLGLSTAREVHATLSVLWVSS